MDECILFVDETKPTNNNPYFCFAGMIITKQCYKDELIPNINRLKKQYFDTSIVFHFSEMKKNRGCFSKLQNAEFRNKFWNEYEKI